MNNTSKYCLTLASLILAALLPACSGKGGGGSGTCDSSKSIMEMTFENIAKPVCTSAELLKKYEGLSSEELAALGAPPKDEDAAYFPRLLAQWQIDSNVVEIFSRYLDRFGFGPDGNGSIKLDYKGPDSRGTPDAVCHQKGALPMSLDILKLFILFIQKGDRRVYEFLECEDLFLARALFMLDQQGSFYPASELVKGINDQDLRLIVRLKDFQGEAFVTLKHMYQVADLETKQKFWKKMPEFLSENKSAEWPAAYRVTLGMPREMPQ